MEMTSNVMRFALATYFMKRSGSHDGQSLDVVYKSIEDNKFNNEEEESEGVDSEFLDVVSTHVSNLRQLLEDQRFQDWTRGIVELREYVAAHQLLGSLVAVLVTMIRRQDEDALLIIQVIEHMCFENNGTPSEVFNQLVELLFEALSHCCKNKENIAEAIWLLRAVDAVIRGFRQYYEQRYEVASGRKLKDFDHYLEESIADAIQDCLANTKVTTKD